MMISSAAGMYAAAAALDRQLRSDGPTDDASSASAPESGPDVVVSLSGGASSAPATYDASGRMPASPSLQDLGANAPDSMAQADESQDDGSDDDATSAASASPSAASTAVAPDDDSGGDATDDASVDQDAAVPA